MQLHVIYRYHAGENAKGRPDYYSKRLALSSFLRAVDQCRPGPDVVFLHDGPVPADVAQAMARHGRLLPVRGGSARASYLRAVTLPRRLGWADEAFALLSEDDYLYRPSALTRFRAAAEAAPPGRYLAPYTSDWTRPVPATAPSAEQWWSARSATSTFGARVSTLKEDERLLQFCTLAGGAWDFATCLTLQGRPPYAWSQLARAVTGRSPSDPERDVRRLAARAVVRAAVNVRAHRRPSRCRSLAAPEPNIATHLEIQFLAAGHDWAALADETAEWARLSLPGLLLPARSDGFIAPSG